MKGLSFLVNEEYFAVDVDIVQKVARKMTITPVPTAPDEIIGITNLKGRVITVLSLYRLLGHMEKRKEEYGVNIVNAIVFKPVSDNEDQIGLFIDKPGDLVEINDETVRPPSLPTGAEESFCISGIAEVDNRLYRIINIESIESRYKFKGEKTAEIILNGGIENEKDN